MASRFRDAGKMRNTLTMLDYLEEGCLVEIAAGDRD